MKPLLVRDSMGLNGIDFDQNAYPYFYNPWHYHPELELTLVLESYGQRLVGDSIENFDKGDLVLVGGNLPHVWKNDQSYFSPGSKKKAEAIVVKFLPGFAGSDLLDIHEMKGVRRLLHEKAIYGIKPTGRLKKKVSEEMLVLSQMNEAERIIQLLKILYMFSASEEYQILASLGYMKNISYANE